MLIGLSHQNWEKFLADHVKDDIMTGKSKLKTSFEFNVLRLYQMPNLLSGGVKIPGLRK